jgi:HEXXH motif-containing protein
MREQRVEVLRMVVDGPDERFAKDMGAVAVDNCLIDEFTEVLRARIPGNFAPMELSPSDGDRITLSMRLIRHLVPDLWQEMSSWHLRFVPLELQPPAARQSCSDRQVPGTVWATVDPDPFELIDLIVHEFFHLRLFQLEEEYRLLRNPAVPCLSPFRPDLRNAEGLLQAVYVAAGLSTVFEKIYQRTTPSRRGIRRLAVWRESVRTGIQLLRESGATPTGAGRQLIDSMWVCNESAQARLRQDVPFMANWAGSVVAEHLAQAGKPDSAGPWFLAI